MSNHKSKVGNSRWIWVRGFHVFGTHLLRLIVVLGLNLIVVGCGGTDRL